ncbi:MAG: alpha-amylase [Lachnospiraceae bacterium]|nr:alpha-amylase [Lachnospiraceae bacterium]
MNDYAIKKGDILPLGAYKKGNGINFSVSCPGSLMCKINLYQKGTLKKLYTITLDESYMTGSIFSAFIEGLDFEKLDYTYEIMNKEFVDPYAVKINGRDLWGKPVVNKKSVRSGFDFSSFDFSDDFMIKRRWSETIMYKVHLRGFTQSKTSKSAYRGTFKGMTEKIPYLKELGVNCVMFMPIYEFDEILVDKYVVQPEKPIYMEFSVLEAKVREVTEDPVVEHSLRTKKFEGVVPYKINYWGYSEESNYFAPKSSYAYEPDNASLELKEMIREFHKAGIEVVMEFYFSYWTNKELIIDCLRYWKLNYHIDGFKINNNVAPLNILATDPVLSDTKLITDGWDINGIYKEDYVPVNKTLAEMNDGFMVDCRKFIKGDEALTNNMAFRFRRNSNKQAIINYMTNSSGFTLNDVYSYDIKHNENNGESNRDGTDYNFCWNCGHEGSTRKLKIMQLRKKMIKNALLTLLLSQGTPMILAGDEFCNTQKGNNNAYCQDNDVSWLNWNLNNSDKEIYNFTKELIKLRKEHPILRMNEEFRISDYVACGYPDISYHGIKAWFPDFSNYSRTLGIMLCGEYAVINKGSSRRGINKELIRNSKDCSFYIGFNMHWESHEFALPKLPLDEQWEVVVNTHSEKNYDQKAITGNSFLIRERSIVVFKSVKKVSKD